MADDDANLKQRIKDGLVAVSLANLCFISAWFHLLYDVEGGYFKKPAMPVSLLAMAANLAGLALLAFLTMRLLRRVQTRWVHLVFDGLFLLLLLLPLDFCRRDVLHLAPHKILVILRHPWAIISVFAIGWWVVWQHRRVARAAAVAVGILSPLALFTLARIAFLSLGVEALAKQPPGDPTLAAPAPRQPGRPRVIWIIFDETDQRLAFEERPASLRMPEFDRLRAASLHATNAYPPADSTLVSMPALISGQPVAAASVKNASDLAVTLSGGGATLWSKLPSVFAGAREIGVSTALLGWYHPYARVLAGDLNYCTWHPYPGWFPGQEPTFAAAIVSQIACLGAGLKHERLYADVCRAMMAESLSLVTNRAYGLVLLHLPVPHRPGIYLPEKDEFTIRTVPDVTGYFNNLALADRWLGKLRAALEASGQRDHTWLILSADHSWRGSQQYDGRRDLRVPFLLKAPSQNQPITYSARMNTLVTRDLILAVLRGELAEAAQTVAWLDGHRSTQATAGGGAAEPD